MAGFHPDPLTPEPSIMLELNPLYNQVKELQGRVEALRGYL